MGRHKLTGPLPKPAVTCVIQRSRWLLKQETTRSWPDSGIDWPLSSEQRSGWRAGKFGRSIRSGRLIPDERLEADPAAELTVVEAGSNRASNYRPASVPLS
jgi:hypothetical protein